MSKQPNPTLIGLFVIGAAVMMVAAVLVFGSGTLFKQTDLSVTYFEGSVTGLKKGSSVLFRGFPIGEVAEVYGAVDPSTNEVDIIVLLEVDRNAIRDPLGIARPESIEEVVDGLVKQGLRTKLISESLVTGQLAVELDFYPESPAVYRGRPDFEYAEIPSVPSDLQRLQQVMDGMVARVEAMDVESLIASATRVLDTLDRLANSEQLASILEGADRLVNSQDTQQLTTDLRAAIGKLDATLGQSQQLLATLDAQVEPLAAKLDPTLEQLDRTLVETQETLRGVQALTGEDSELVYRTHNTLDETEKAMRSLRNLLDMLERNPEALLRGKKKPRGGRTDE